MTRPRPIGWLGLVYAPLLAWVLLGGVGCSQPSALPPLPEVVDLVTLPGQPTCVFPLHGGDRLYRISRGVSVTLRESPYCWRVTCSESGTDALRVLCPGETP